MQQIFLVAVGGALGSLSRWGLSSLVHHFTGRGFPWGTWAVNIIGAFLFGFIWESLVQRADPSPQIRLLVLTGFMGAFTTFSTFMFESDQLLRGGDTLLCLANLAGQVVVGFGAVAGGIYLARAAA